MTTPLKPATNAEGVYRLAQSWQLAAILSAGHGGVAVLILLLEIPLAWQAGAFVLVLTSWVYELRAAGRFGANAVVELRIAADNTFGIRTRGNGWHECEVRGSTYVTSFLTVLNLQTADGRNRNVIILPDSMADDDYRRLRMWLRWRPPVRSD